MTSAVYPFDVLFLLFVEFALFRAEIELAKNKIDAFKTE